MESVLCSDFVLSSTSKQEEFIGESCLVLTYLKQTFMPNLQVLTEAVVCRVLFAKAGANENVTASGVEFIHNDKLHVVHADKEVIICSGYTSIHLPWAIC